MKHCIYSPIQTDISELIPKLISLSEIPDRLENTRDYGEQVSHVENSKIKHIKEIYKHYWKSSRGILKIYRLPAETRDQVWDKFDWLSDIGEEAKISLQIISGGAVCIPHKDEQRKSSILISLNDNSSFTEFFDEKFPEDQIYPHPDNIFLTNSVRFRVGENWIFNHKSVHGVQLNTHPRITLSIGFNDIGFLELCDYVNRKKYGVV